MIVLVTIVFTVIALLAFIDKASNDLLVEARDADAARLRVEAYGALETTLAVLEEFRLVTGALRSPAEGWSDPLDFAGYEPGEGRTVEIAFADESGKFSLPNTEESTLITLFKSWQLSTSDAEKLADALLGWMNKDHVPRSAGAPTADDYEREAIPFQPADRPLRSFAELETIAFAREVFYDEAGQPNELWHRFVNAFSLYAYKDPSINGAAPDLLAGLGVLDASEQTRLDAYLRGLGPYQSRGVGYFKSAEEIATVVGPQSPAAALGTEIRALRIIVTVREGRGAFRLNALVAPPGGATIPTSAPEVADGEETDAPGPENPGRTEPVAAPTAKTLNYPFTLLEIRENDAMPSPPAPAAS